MLTLSIRFFYERILHDRGEADDALLPGKMEEVRMSSFVAECWCRKGPRVASSRWMTWCDTFKFLSTLWHSRLAELVFL